MSAGPGELVLPSGSEEEGKGTNKFRRRQQPVQITSGTYLQAGVEVDDDIKAALEVDLKQDRTSPQSKPPKRSCCSL